MAYTARRPTPDASWPRSDLGRTRAGRRAGAGDPSTDRARLWFLRLCRNNSRRASKVGFMRPSLETILVVQSAENLVGSGTGAVTRRPLLGCIGVFPLCARVEVAVI